MIELICEEGLGFSLGFKIVDILKDQQRRSEGLGWTIVARIFARGGSLESESEASFVVEVYSHSLLLIQYSVIRVDCKLCTCVHHF